MSGSSDNESFVSASSDIMISTSDVGGALDSLFVIVPPVGHTNAQKGFHDYFADFDELCIALRQRMTRLIMSKPVYNRLSKLDHSRYMKDDIETSKAFCHFLVFKSDPALYDAVVSFVSDEKLIKSRLNDHSPKLPLQLLVSLPYRLDDAELRRRLDPVESAIYLPDERAFRPCLEGTRKNLISTVIDHINQESRPAAPLLIKGGAGTGKSALAVSIAGELEKLGISVFSFVCKHDDTVRATARNIVPTIAWQLCRIPQHRAAIEHVLEMWHGFGYDAHRIGAKEQLKLLLALAPRSKDDSGRNVILPVILVDAVDECDPSGKDFLKDFLLQLALHKADCSLRFTIVVVSRLTDAIDATFQQCATTILDLNEHLTSPDTMADLTQFFKKSLNVVGHEAGIEGIWPTDEEVSQLVLRASGLFVWAAVACAYIGIVGLNCRDQLGDVLGGSGDKDELESLYLRTVKAAMPQRMGKESRSKWLNKYRAILGSVISAAVPLSYTTVSWLSKFSINEVTLFLRHFRPLLASDADPIRLLHCMPLSASSYKDLPLWIFFWQIRSTTNVLQLAASRQCELAYDSTLEIFLTR